MVNSSHVIMWNLNILVAFFFCDRFEGALTDIQENPWCVSLMTDDCSPSDKAFPRITLLYTVNNLLSCVSVCPSQVSRQSCSQQVLVLLQSKRDQQSDQSEGSFKAPRNSLHRLLVHGLKLTEIEDDNECVTTQLIFCH